MLVNKYFSLFFFVLPIAFPIYDLSAPSKANANRLTLHDTRVHCVSVSLKPLKEIITNLDMHDISYKVVHF